MKDRSDTFKMKGRKIDFAAESQQKSRETRQNHIEAIRKLHNVKNKLSPSKPSKDNTIESYEISSTPEMHDVNYDPSSEMIFTFGAPENNKYQDDMPSRKISHTGNMGFPAASNHSKPISLDAISGLLDSKL